MDKQPIAIESATLPFFTYQQGSHSVIEFDSTGCECPVPMVNAMAGLRHIAGHGGMLSMLNGFEPQGLYERIAGHFTWTVSPEGEKQVRICFTPVVGRAGELDFGNNRCRGGNK